jgi:hypothetical protein
MSVDSGRLRRRHWARQNGERWEADDSGGAWLKSEKGRRGAATAAKRRN